jgi:hypothetical protein
MLKTSRVQCQERKLGSNRNMPGTIPHAYRTHKYTSIQQHAMSLQPHARLMHHTICSATDTRRIVGTMASSLPFQAQGQERDLQLSCRGGRGRGFPEQWVVQRLFQ